MQVLAPFPICVHEFDSNKVHMMSRFWCTLTQIHGLVYCQQLCGGKEIHDYNDKVWLWNPNSLFDKKILKNL